jgi:hypothetical protein
MMAWLRSRGDLGRVVVDEVLKARKEPGRPG